jgi:hypothetical protein
MNLTVKIKRLLKRKFATAICFSVSLAAFATLGDGGGKKDQQRDFLYTTRPITYSSKDFSLRSGYNYRANNLLSAPRREKFVMLNTVTNYQKGNTTYIMTLTKKVLLDKVKFNPQVKF